MPMRSYWSLLSCLSTGTSNIRASLSERVSRRRNGCRTGWIHFMRGVYHRFESAACRLRKEEQSAVAGFGSKLGSGGRGHPCEEADFCHGGGVRGADGRAAVDSQRLAETGLH